MNLIGYNASWGENSSDKSSLFNHLPKSQDELKKQRMFESYAEAIIPLGDQPELRNKYSNFQKTVRFGRLLEDLDTMAGSPHFNPSTKKKFFSSILKFYLI